MNMKNVGMVFHSENFMNLLNFHANVFVMVQTPKLALLWFLHLLEFFLI